MSSIAADEPLLNCGLSALCNGCFSLRLQNSLLAYGNTSIMCFGFYLYKMRKAELCVSWLSSGAVCCSVICTVFTHVVIKALFRWIRNTSLNLKV